VALPCWTVLGCATAPGVGRQRRHGRRGRVWWLQYAGGVSHRSAVRSGLAARAWRAGGPDRSGL